MNEHLAIVGSGAIACGLAATAAHHGPVRLLARSVIAPRSGPRPLSIRPWRAWPWRSTPSTCRW